MLKIYLPLGGSNQRITKTHVLRTMSLITLVFALLDLMVMGNQASDQADCLCPKRGNTFVL